MDNIRIHKPFISIFLNLPFAVYLGALLSILLDGYSKIDIFLFLGVTLFALVYNALSWIKFIEITDSQIYLQRFMKSEKINLDEIKSIDIKSNRIIIDLTNGLDSKILLNGFSKQDKNILLDYFQKL